MLLNKKIYISEKNWLQVQRYFSIIFLVKFDKLIITLNELDVDVMADNTVEIYKKNF